MSQNDGVLRTYLADGLYADYDGYQIRLFCEREDGTHEIFLESATWNALAKFVQQIGWIKAVPNG